MARPVTNHGRGELLGELRRLRRGGAADVDEARAILDALRDSEARLSLAHEAAGIGTWDLDVQMGVAQWSEGLRHLFGVNASTMEPTIDNFLKLVHPEDRAQVEQTLRTKLDTRGDYRDEYRIVRPDGQVRWVTCRWRVQEAGPDKPLRVYGVCIDVTDLKLAQRKLQELNASLNDRTREAEERSKQLRRLTIELSQAEHRERRRLAQVLHDNLQQTLFAATVRLRIARDTRNFTEARNQVRQSMKLLEEALRESRSLTAELSPAVLHDLGLAAAIAWLAQQIHAKHGMAVEVHADRDADPADENLASLLFQAAREFLFNAVKHANVKTANIELIRLRDRRIALTISDRGAGFNPSKLKQGSGNTFGLSTLRERVGLMEGKVEIDSAPGKGTRIRVTVTEPAGSALAGEPSESYDAPAARPRVKKGHAGRIRVVLADDHKIVRAGLASLLASQPDIQIVGEAGDGLAAVELARTGGVDVVLMDVSMPRLNGIEATERITRACPGVAVIGLSMHEEQTLAVAMRDAGADAYLTKGGPLGPLVTAIRKAAAARRPALTKI